MTASRGILIVDDDDDAAAAIATCLVREGFPVYRAGSGAEALARFAVEAPALVLLDAVMPGLDGFSTCRAIRAVPEWRDVPVLFMTGLGDTQHVVEGFRAGGVDYLVKPIAPPELVARVRVHLAAATRARRIDGAIDASGRAMFAVDQTGMLAWATPEARRLLASAGAVDAGGRMLRLGIGAVPIGESIALAVRQDVAGPVATRLDRGDGSALFAVAPDGDELARVRRVHALTAREAEVLQGVARGEANRDIAVALNVSPRTIDKHVEQILRKLGVANRAAAAAAYVTATTVNS